MGQLYGNRFNIALRNFSNDDADLLKASFGRRALAELSERSACRSGWNCGQKAASSIISAISASARGRRRRRASAFASCNKIGRAPSRRFSRQNKAPTVRRTRRRAAAAPSGNFLLDPLNLALRAYAGDKDARAAYESLPNGLRNTTVEGTLLKVLSLAPANFKGALMAVPRSSRSLYVHAVQSLVFNRIASRRAATYGARVLDGDLFADADGAPRSDDDGEPAGTIDDVLLPLPCHAMRFPRNEIESWYRETLAADGISLDAFGLAGAYVPSARHRRRLTARSLFSEFGVSPAYRRFVERPHKVESHILFYNDPNAILQTFRPFAERDAAKTRTLDETPAPLDAKWQRALILHFTLRSGTYANIALRELLRVDLGKSAQKSLSEAQNSILETSIKEEYGDATE